MPETLIGKTSIEIQARKHAANSVMSYVKVLWSYASNIVIFIKKFIRLNL